MFERYLAALEYPAQGGINIDGMIWVNGLIAKNKYNVYVSNPTQTPRNFATLSSGWRTRRYATIQSRIGPICVR